MITTWVGRFSAFCFPTNKITTSFFSIFNKEGWAQVYGRHPLGFSLHFANSWRRLGLKVNLILPITFICVYDKCIQANALPKMSWFEIKVALSMWRYPWAESWDSHRINRHFRLLSLWPLIWFLFRSEDCLIALDVAQCLYSSFLRAITFSILWMLISSGEMLMLGGNICERFKVWCISIFVPWNI